MLQPTFSAFSKLSNNFTIIKQIIAPRFFLSLLEFSNLFICIFNLFALGSRILNIWYKLVDFTCEFFAVRKVDDAVDGWVDGLEEVVDADDVGQPLQ